MHAILWIIKSSLDILHKEKKDRKVTSIQKFIETAFACTEAIFLFRFSRASYNSPAIKAHGIK